MKISRPNGWYLITSETKDSISKEPIVTVKDFVALKLDSDFNATYQIVGTISKHRSSKWADATEKAIGKRIGFVHNNKVITAPQVNQRIEGGNFAISGHNIKVLFHQIRQEKVDSIESLFKDWSKDSLYNELSKIETDSMMMQLDYWEASKWKDMGANPLTHHWYNITDTIEYLKLERKKGKKVTSENDEADSLREQEHKKAWREAHKYRAIITDSVFLKTTVPMSDQATNYLTPTGWNMDYAYNQVVYLEALERAKKHLAVKNNQLILSLKSGAEINVSDNLFQYIARYVISNWNELIRKGMVKIEKTDKGYYDIVPPKKAQQE